MSSPLYSHTQQATQKNMIFSFFVDAKGRDLDLFGVEN
jgi:hypothetical protein